MDRDRNLLGDLIPLADLDVIHKYFQHISAQVIISQILLEQLHAIVADSDSCFYVGDPFTAGTNQCYKFSLLFLEALVHEEEILRVDETLRFIDVKLFDCKV